MELIRLLLVFFLAGYFAQRWDVLRHARETRPSVAALTRRVDIPPLEYTVPVLVSVALCLVFFFLQKDMGPALVFACLFLSLYGIARGSALVPVAGLALVALGFVAGFFIGIPHTVRRARVHVAFALGQPGSRRRSTGALAVGLRHRRRLRHGDWAGRSAGGAGGPHRSDPLRAGRRVGLRGRGRGVRALRASGLAGPAHRAARAHAITNSSWRRAWPRPPRCRSC